MQNPIILKERSLTLDRALEVLKDKSVIRFHLCDTSCWGQKGWHYAIINIIDGIWYVKYLTLLSLGERWAGIQKIHRHFFGDEKWEEWYSEQEFDQRFFNDSSVDEIHVMTGEDKYA